MAGWHLRLFGSGFDKLEGDNGKLLLISRVFSGKLLLIDLLTFEDAYG